jgi:two-component system nitrate/nitrite response regulator NarL
VDTDELGTTSNLLVLSEGARDAPTCVLIVDDHQLFADVIHRTLEADGMELSRAVATGADALRVFQDERPNLVLLDLALPDRSGLAVGQAIMEQSPGTVVVALTALDDPQLVKQAIRAGFRGYGEQGLPGLTTPGGDHPSDGRGCRHRRPEPSRGQPNQELEEGGGCAARRSTHSARGGRFSPFSREGTSSVDMARRLDISPNTLRTHVQSVLTKLQVHSRLEAATFAVRNELVLDGDWRAGSSVRRSQAAS